MLKLVQAAALPLLLLSAGACQSVPAQTTTSQTMVEQITGALTYRERIALPPGAQMELVVSDITEGATEELVLSRVVQPITASVPIPFTLDISTRDLPAGPLYGLRAFIKGPDDDVLFGTTSPVLLDLIRGNPDVGTIMLVMTDSDDAGAAGIAGNQSGDWRITQFNNDVAPQDTAPVVTFGVDGRAYGSTGCNRFMTSYTLSGNRIDLLPIATTLQACEPGLMEQERRFLEVMNDLQRVSLDRDGRLVLEAGGGKRLVAERSAPSPMG